MFHEVSDWLDNVLKQDVPEAVVAFCFNLYDDDNDWSCDEITDFGTRNGFLTWNKDGEWDSFLEEMISVLKEYLKKGRYADVLKSRAGVGVGFVDGNIEILYSKQE